MSRNAGPSLDSFKQVSENGKGNWEAGKADSAGDSLLKQTRAAHILSHVAAFQKAKYREKFQLFPENMLTYTSLKERFLLPARTEELFIGKKGTKRGAGSGSPGESSQKQAGQEKTPAAEGSFHGNRWLHSLPTRSAQSYFLLLQNLLHQLTAEFGCGWAGMSVSMAHTHSSSPSIFKMQTA